jgi:acyl-CoA synthetase (AMP-forming)/AMP-acid ligase II
VPLRQHHRETVPGLLEAACQATPDGLAVRTPRQDLRWAELSQVVKAAAASLSAGGVGANSRVLVRVDRPLDLLVALLGCMEIGAVPAPINPKLVADELAYVALRSEPSAALTSEGLEVDLPILEGLGLWVISDSVVYRRRRCANEKAPVPPRPSDAASILFTSGSTANPKGVVLRHGSYYAMGTDLAALLRLRPRQDAVLLHHPLFHVAGQACSLLPSIAGQCPLIVPDRFSASNFWDEVERWTPTVWMTGLAFLEMVSRRGGVPPLNHSFRHVVSNLRLDTWEVATQGLHLPIGTYLGQTENCGRGSIALEMQLYEPGYVGGAYAPNDGIRIIAGDGPAPTGRVGEIEFRGPGVMAGYFGDEAASREALREDGWLRTGDLGWLDENGSLFFSGRIKNVIKRAGENIAAEEVELLLLRHPEVVDVAVLGVSDPVREEEVKAVVVLRTGAILDPMELVRYSRSHLTEYKIPRYVEFAQELPHTPSGKTDIAAIRRMYSSIETSWDREAVSVPTTGQGKEKR